MGKILWEIYFGYGVSVRPPASLYRLSGWKWGGRTASGDGSVRAIFPDGNLLQTCDSFGEKSY